MKRFLFLLLILPALAVGQLPGTGPISFSAIMAELGIAPGTQTSMTGNVSGVAPFGAGSLHATKTAPLNSVPPHAMSEWYGYRQVDDFTIQTTGSGDAGTACGDAGSFTTKWHNGAGALPTVNDTIWNEGTADNLFNGGGNWYLLTGQSTVIRVSNVGVVLEEEDCNQTFSFSLEFTVIDKDAQNVDVTVTSNTDWTLSFTDINELDWLDTGNSPTTGTGNATRTLVVTENNTGTNNVYTISGTYGLGTQQSNLTQLPNSLIPATLTYDDSVGASSCSGTSGSYLMDTNDLATATVVYNSTLFGPQTFTGYVSNGTVWKYVVNSIVQPGGDFC